MSISSVNPYMSMLAAYKAATADTKQSNTPLDTVENTQAKATTRPGDTVTISQEAAKRSEMAQTESSEPRMYAPMTSQAIFDKAMANLDENGTPIFEPMKPIESILPENLKIIEELRQMKATTKSEMLDKETDIFAVMRYGDKEIFSSTEEVRARSRTYTDGVLMYMDKMARDAPVIKWGEEWKVIGERRG